MRTRDVQLGETYLVVVPRRDPGGPLSSLRCDDPHAIAEWWRMMTLSGGRFRMTVTDIDPTATPPTVEGMRVVNRPRIRLDLTLEQVLGLGLPPGVYYVEGVLRDETGATVELPDVDTLRVPIRWLRLPDDTSQNVLSHPDLDQRNW